MTTMVHISKGAAERKAVVTALRDAGIVVIEVETWEAALEALRNNSGALVVCDGDALDAADPASIASAVQRLAESRRGSNNNVPADVARALSHDLRTPLSAMAGWIHLLETGKLDGEATKRAIAKLRGNIEEEVRTIDRFLGTNSGRS
jgi:signal transduction histidine kinase